MCFSTARLESTSDSAIAVLLLPCAISARTWRSRGDSSASAERSIAALPLHERVDQARVDHRAAARDGLDRVAQLGGIVHSLLEQVAAPVGARLEQGQRVARARRTGSGRSRRPRGASRAAGWPRGSPRPSGRAASGCRSARRRAPRARSPRALREVAAGRDDLELGLEREQLQDALACDQVVIGNDDAHAHPGRLYSTLQSRFAVHPPRVMRWAAGAVVSLDEAMSVGAHHRLALGDGRWRSVFSVRSARYAAGVVAIAVGYDVFAQGGEALLLTGPAGAFWPATGVGIAVLYLGGLRWWPGVLLGDLLSREWAQLPLGTALAESAGNITRAVVAAIILRRLIGSRAAMDRLAHVGARAGGRRGRRGDQRDRRHVRPAGRRRHRRVGDGACSGAAGGWAASRAGWSSSRSRAHGRGRPPRCGAAAAPSRAR